MRVLFVYYIPSILTVSFIFQLCVSLRAAYLLNKYINKKMIESMKTRTFRMDKEKGNWFLSMIGKTKKALFPKLPMTQSLETEKCTEGKFSKVLKVQILVFPECTASLLGPRLQNVFCKYWHPRKWREACSPQLLFSAMRNVGKISCHEVSLDWTLGPGRGQCSAEPLPLVYHCSFPRDDYHSLCLNKLSFLLTETVIFPAINSPGQLEFTKSCFYSSQRLFI